MEDKIEISIRFAIQREILLSLLKDGYITDKELNKTLNKLRKKSNCKLIVTYSNI